MVSNLKSIEVSLEKLEICPKQVVTIWIYGALQVPSFLHFIRYKNMFLQEGKGETNSKVGGVSAIFSVDSMAPISSTMLETKCSKLTINSIQIQGRLN